MKVINDSTEMVDVSKLDTFPSNPRVGDLDLIRESIRTNGFFGTVGVQRSSGRIVWGNHRFMAAKAEGATEVPVTWVDCSDTEARRILAVDNRSNDAATYDQAKLAALLESFEGDFAGTGYGMEDLDDLLRELGDGSSAAGSGDRDAVPEPPSQPLAAVGDLWLLGDHRLMCGDSSDKEQVLRLLDGVSVDVVWTDPPYGIAHSAMPGARSLRSRPITADEDLDRAASVLLAALSVVDADSGFVACSWRSLAAASAAMIGGGMEPKACIVWDKERRVQNLDRFAKQHEFLLYAGPYGGQPTIDVDVWQIARDFEPDHPTPKPVELVARSLRACPGVESVYDPFGGSGSTLVAAQELGRVAYVMELDPLYVDVICRRFQEFTGTLPILERTGEAHDFTA